MSKGFFQSFEEHLIETRKKEYLADLTRLAGLLYYSARESELDISVRLDLSEKVAQKIVHRGRDRLDSGRPRRWDERNWRGMNKIRERLDASVKASEAPNDT